nr:lytic transglycosylase domain-containing protein [Halovulum dunhuangense]
MATILVATVLCGANPGAASAEQAGDFTFKRVTPPGGGAQRLINIHVEPVAPVERVLSSVPDLPPAPNLIRRAVPAPSSDGVASWFWRELSPGLSAASTSRLATAMQVLARNVGASQGMTPSLERMQRMADSYGADILAATAGTRVSPALVLAVMSVESAGRPAAVSSAGAVGLMQLMPETAKRFGVTDRTDPAQSIRGGVRYLDFLLNEFGGDALLALAGYNAGEGAVARAGGVPNYRETRAYVPKVVSAWAQARQLCVTMPVNASDGCLFSGVQVAER